MRLPIHNPQPASRGVASFLQPALLTVALLRPAPALPAAKYEPAAVTPPVVMREFRGAWVASVNNLNWPSKPGLSTAEQKAELRAILDRAERLRLNAIILQVRPACDALYASKLEPWSEYLTGAQGRAPSPFYDPLEFAVAEAHRRGLELHAWLNPYRARHPSAKGALAPTHLCNTRPSLVRAYGRHLWLDPGERAVQDHSLAVVLDVVRRYDVDGLHFDDYFYPYKERSADGAELDFPDEASWLKYGQRTRLSRDDWRRQNVDTFIRRVHQAIKAEKPWVKFGVSPFGIWRPGNPPQIRGFDPYDKLYADARAWLVQGWVDYLAPQLYWAIDPPEQSFPVLLKWWSQQNPNGRALWPGMNSVRVGGRTGGWAPVEIGNQIRLTRQQKAMPGHIHWSFRALESDRNGLAPALLESVYAEPALVPAMPWLSEKLPPAPTVSVRAEGGGAEVTWRGAAKASPARWWLVQTRTAGKWTARVLPGATNSLKLGAAPETVSVRAIDRYGNASAPAAARQRR